MVLASFMYDSRSRKRAFNSDTVHTVDAKPAAEVVAIPEAGNAASSSEQQGGGGGVEAPLPESERGSSQAESLPNPATRPSSVVTTV